MNKRALLFGTSSIISSILLGSTVLVSGHFNNQFTAQAIDDNVWYHYAAVAPTDTTHGSKEFWASSGDNCNTHQLTDPGVVAIDRNFSLNEFFSTLDRNDDRFIPSLNEQKGITPVINGNKATYGIYPQTKIDDDDLINTLNLIETPQSNGWYLYNGEYYAKMLRDKVLSWYKCEIITWDVLKEDNGSYLLLSTKILDGHCYYDYGDDESGRVVEDGNAACNNYKYSEIRAWLNGYDGSSYNVPNFTNKGFLNTAFSLGNSYLETTFVDNSEATTELDGTGKNDYAKWDTEDKVFLLSYKDYITSPFDSNESRRALTTDWSKAGLLPDGDGYARYWTRSPDCDFYNLALYVEADGNFPKYEDTRSGSFGVRPAIKITIA